MTQADEQSMTLPKTHAPIMLTQLTIKDGPRRTEKKEMRQYSKK